MRHPALLLAIAWVALLVLASLRRRAELGDPSGPRGLMFAASIAVIVSYCAIVVWYTFKASYFDAAEPTITAVAAAFASGQPLYPALDAPERYAHIYGPVLFIVHAAAFAVAGASILASKAVGSVAALSSLGLTYVVYSRRAGVLAACNVTAASALVYLYFSNATFWTRSDPLLILSTSIGLAGALSRRRFAAAIVLGLATGAAINLKVTGAIYLIPVFAIALSKHGVRSRRGCGRPRGRRGRCPVPAAADLLLSLSGLSAAVGAQRVAGIETPRECRVGSVPSDAAAGHVVGDPQHSTRARVQACPGGSYVCSRRDRDRFGKAGRRLLSLPPVRADPGVCRVDGACAERGPDRPP